MVAIKDMDMPSDCASCDIRSGNFCYAKNKPPYNIKGSLFTRDGDCPLVDIEERKVGKWKAIDDTHSQCMECGAIFCITSSNEWEVNYCPNCGYRITKED